MVKYYTLYSMRMQTYSNKFFSYTTMSGKFNGHENAERFSTQTYCMYAMEEK
jgi:hypothetical protein